MPMILLFAAFLAFTSDVWARHDHVSLYSPGEYQLYDLDKNAFHVVKKEAGYYTKKVIKAPFLAARFTRRAAMRHIKTTAQHIRQFLLHIPHTHDDDVEEVVAKWERRHTNYFKNARNGVKCILHTPEVSWRILKNVVNKTIIGIPKKTLRAMKRSFMQVYTLMIS